ncbi:urease accessory protein UreD [Salinisphaera sp. Q1T1-3]|uniref:urease accessory protein UreD n=1 Tax=Salinisphaera sp. Q1T1-3 TaxID=2321229 RepID=UPI000E74799A|nr:urease accessory protein UreD [Salinisphaera sp. Q1T1-3]RJS94255.1 urease accessory protein UreD [Salinisphaera sp. Q1T1-3]
MPHWLARLALAFARRGPRSVLVRRRHDGPLYVQRALYPEADGTPHLMLLHPPGGMVQGDRIEIEAHVAAAAQALITTPSASRFYRMPATDTTQTVWLVVGADAMLEWLPLEAILFDGARVRNTLSLQLDSRARAIAWDIVTFGRPAIGERLTHGALDTRLRVSIDAQPVLDERTHVPGLAKSDLQDAVWGLDGARVMGTLVAYRPEGFDEKDSTAVREAAAAVVDVRIGITRVDGLLLVRALGAAPTAVREALSAVWAVLRPRVAGKPVVAPRIWST